MKGQNKKSENFTYESDDVTENIFHQNDKTRTKIRSHHKDSVAKPLNFESEDDDKSPNSKSRHNMFYKDGYQSEVSRYIDDKRSTIKEQMEEEEEFTGSSLNVSGNLNFSKGSKMCKHKRDKKSSREIERTNTKNDHQRKLSELNSNPEFESPVNVLIKHRKFTDNVGDTTKGSKQRSKNNDNDISTTLGGTSGVSPLFKYRKESDLDGYAASVSMVSTPTMVNKVIRLNKAGEPINNDQEKSLFQKSSQQKN